MPLTDSGPPPVLAAHGLGVSLGGLPVLREIGLQVHRGEAVALLGGNGSGKSTLVRAILGLVPHQRGEVHLFGTPLAGFRDWRRIGYVPQRSTSTLSTAKVREVVAAGRLAHRTPFVPLRRSDRAAIAAAVASVGLTDQASTSMNRLSGGQQQRVLIARALAGAPDLLVLDEPTAGVDLEHQSLLAALLSDLVRGGTAVLVVLHELGALGDLLHRAVWLSDGRVARDSGVLADQPLPRGGHEHEATPRPGWLSDSVLDRPGARDD
jgi:zinc transport system ATP-binding protein